MKKSFKHMSDDHVLEVDIPDIKHEKFWIVIYVLVICFIPFWGLAASMFIPKLNHIHFKYFFGTDLGLFGMLLLFPWAITIAVAAKLIQIYGL